MADAAAATRLLLLLLPLYVAAMQYVGWPPPRPANTNEKSKIIFQLRKICSSVISLRQNKKMVVLVLFLFRATLSIQASSFSKERKVGRVGRPEDWSDLPPRPNSIDLLLATTCDCPFLSIYLSIYIVLYIHILVSCTIDEQAR